MTYDRRTAFPRQADTAQPPPPVTEGEELVDDIGELEVAEYVVMMLAYDTYYRYLKEQTKSHDPVDTVLQKGVTLLKMAGTQHGDAIRAFLDGHLPSPTHKKMLGKAFRFLPTRSGLSLRALQMRTLLSRGGATTMRKVFKSNRALQEVRTAIQFATMEDADAALDKFAVISIRNARIRSWIDLAAKTAGSGTFQNPITVGVAQADDDKPQILESRVQEEAASPTSESASDARADHEDRIAKVQVEAQEAAKKALEVNGEADIPPTKSEVIGIATAVATAAMTNPVDDQNVPEPLKKLDPEQRAAAMSDGRVLVAAGAGAGKSATLVARIKYLVEVKKVSPSRIFATSFNSSAAAGLKKKVAKAVGQGLADSMTIGTMHSTFRLFIRGDKNRGGRRPGFGTPEEQAMVSDENLIAAKKKDEGDDEKEYQLDDKELSAGRGPMKVRPPTPTQVTFAIKGILKDCGPVGLAQMTGFPAKLFESVGTNISAKQSKQYLENWRGNGIDFKTAREGADTVEELLASVWYELYLGLKGDLGPNWEPQCKSPTFGRFMNNFRKDRRRLGDLDDMVRIFRDILKRDPEARKAAQGMYDHLLVDEAQDLNTVQTEIFDMMTENIGCDDKEKSFWTVGDDKQSIYSFRGARPSLFRARNGADCWKTRLIQTNYRCEPEIVEVANKIAANNTNLIPMQAKADPKKTPGKASIEVIAPGDYVDGAVEVFDDFEREMSLAGLSPSDFAVLSRTNAELNAFEDQCILREIPYARNKGTGFLESPETNAVMGYMDLAMSSDPVELQEAFAAAIMKPDRGLYLSAEAVSKIVQDCIKQTALEENKDSRQFNPLDFVTRRSSARKLAMMIKAPYKATLRSQAEKLKAQYGHQAWYQRKERDGGGSDWKYNEAVDELTDRLMDMGNQIMSIRTAVQRGLPTSDVLDKILDSVSVETGYYNRKTGQDTRKVTSLRDQIREDRAFYGGEDEDSADEREEKQPTKLVMSPTQGLVREVDEESEEPGKAVDPLAGLGAVRYLYQLATPNEKDKALGIDPSNGQDFYRKLDRYKAISKQLQDAKKHPERLTLSTIHSVKGAQWKEVAVCMSYGFFPSGGRDEKNLLAAELEKVKARDPRDPSAHEAARVKLDSIQEDKMEQERNLAYVGVTRAKDTMKVVCSQQKVPPDLRKTGPVLGMFVREGGLKIGENVVPPQASEPPAQFETVMESEPDTANMKFAAFKFDHLAEDISRYLDEDYSYNRSES